MNAETTILPSIVPTTDDDGPGDDPRVLTSIAVIECLLLVIGVFGNTMLFLLVRSKRMSKHSFSVYFSFAAISDTLTIFWNSLQDAYEISNQNGLEENASRSYTFGCGILELFDGWFPLTSAWLMVFLCIDRYVSICHPNAAQTFCRRKVAFCMCCVLIVFTFIFALPWSLITPDKADNDPSDGPVRCGDEAADNLDGLEVVDIMLMILIPVFIVIVLNALILMTLSKKKAFRSEQSLTEHGKLQNRINRLNVSIFYLLVITALTWLPYAIVNLTEMIYFDFEGHDDSTETQVHVDYAWHVTLVMWLFTFVQNFYVLMIMSPVYRKEVKRQLACLPCFGQGEFERLEINSEGPSNQDDANDDV